MREQLNPVRSWAGYVLGMVIEAAYVTVMIAVAALVAWAVMPR